MVTSSFWSFLVKWTPAALPVLLLPVLPQADRTVALPGPATVVLAPRADDVPPAAGSCQAPAPAEFAPVAAAVAQPGRRRPRSLADEGCRETPPPPPGSTPR